MVTIGMEGPFRYTPIASMKSHALPKNPTISRSSRGMLKGMPVVPFGVVLPKGPYLLRFV